MLTVDVDKKRSAKIDTLPDRCPHCGKSVQAILIFEYPVVAYDGSIAPVLWFTVQCPARDCSRPFFAVYRRTQGVSLSHDYHFAYATPIKPQKYQIDSNISELSESFYDILNQAFAAEQYSLHLVAGMGYRKALEYLARDYVVAPLRAKRAAALEANDDAAVEAINKNISALLDRPLAKIVATIPHDLTREAAQRAVWLGNDETHYTRVWTKHDVEDLKQLLWIILTFISNEITANKYVAHMDRKAPP